MIGSHLYNSPNLADQHREAINRLWGAMPWAIVGSTGVVSVPILWWAIAIHRFPWDPPHSVGWQVVTGIFALALMATGVGISLPWFKANRDCTRINRERWALLETRNHPVVKSSPKAGAPSDLPRVPAR